MISNIAILNIPVIMKAIRVVSKIGKIIFSLRENSTTIIEMAKVLLMLPIKAPEPQKAYRVGLIDGNIVLLRISPQSLPIMAPSINPGAYVPKGIAAVVKHQNIYSLMIMERKSSVLKLSFQRINLLPFSSLSLLNRSAITALNPQLKLSKGKTKMLMLTVMKIIYQYLLKMLLLDIALICRK